MKKDNKQNIHKNHRRRMWEKFNEVGFDGWQKHEILEFMLYNVHAQADTNPIAHSIMDYNMGSYVNLFENVRDMRMTQCINGVGERTILFLRSLKAFCDYYRTEEIKEKPIQLNRHNFLDIVHSIKLSAETEEMVMICLDRFMRVKSVMRITEYSDEGMAVTNIDKIARIATLHSAKNVVLAHTHPSGSTEVSLEDIHMTVRADHLLSALGIALVDHFVICGDKVISVKITMNQKEY